MLGIEPGAVFQKLYGSRDGLLNRTSRVPTQGVYAAAIKQDQGAIADPAPLPPGINNSRGHAQMLTNPPDRIIDFACIVSSKIKDVYICRIVPDGSENRIYAVLDVKVGFSLAAIAKHVENVGVLPQLTVEVDDMTVRIAGP